MNLASPWQRFVATAIDVVFVPLLTLLYVLITGVLEHAEDYASPLVMFWPVLLAILAYLTLNGWLLYQHGQTLGKRFLKIRIVATGTTDPIPFWKLICIRALFFPLLYCVLLGPLAVLPILDQLLIFAKNRRCVHDWAAGSQVINCEVVSRVPLPETAEPG